MKELTDIILVNRLKDLLVYKEHFVNKLRELNDKVGLLKEEGVSLEGIAEKLERERFELILLRDDTTKVAMEVEVIVELYKKTKQEFPEEYKTLTDSIEGYKEVKRSELFTFVIDSGQLVEREKGLIKTKLDLTKKSEEYQFFKQRSVNPTHL